MARNSIAFTMAFKNLQWDYGFYIEGDATEVADRYANPEILATVNFWDALLFIHGAGVELQKVSVANDEVKGTGESRTRYINRSNPPGTGSLIPRITDVTGNSMLSSMFGAGNAKRKLTMSGLPDAMIERQADGTAVRNAMFNEAFNALHTILLTQQFKIKFALNPTVEQLKRVRLMEPSKVSVGDPPALVEDASHTKFTTTEAHGFAVGDTIDFIHREPTRGTEELTGTFKVVEVPGLTSFILATRVNFRGPSYMPTELYVFEPTYDSELITRWFFDDWGTRKRGEGGGPRGKAPSRKKKAV